MVNPISFDMGNPKDAKSTQSYGYSLSNSESHGHLTGTHSCTSRIQNEKTKCHYVNPIPESGYALNISATDQDDKFDTCLLTRTVADIESHHAWQSLLRNVSFNKILQRSTCITMDNPDLNGLHNPFYYKALTSSET